MKFNQHAVDMALEVIYDDVCNLMSDRLRPLMETLSAAEMQALTLGITYKLLEYVLGIAAENGYKTLLDEVIEKLRKAVK